MISALKSTPPHDADAPVPVVSLPVLRSDRNAELHEVTALLAEQAAKVARARKGFAELPGKVAATQAAIAEIDAQIASRDGLAEARLQMGLDDVAKADGEPTPNLRTRRQELERELERLTAAQGAGPEAFAPLHLDLMEKFRLAKTAVEAGEALFLQWLESSRKQVDEARAALVGIERFVKGDSTNTAGVEDAAGRLPIDPNFFKMLKDAKAALRDGAAEFPPLIPPPPPKLEERRPVLYLTGEAAVAHLANSA